MSDNVFRIPRTKEGMACLRYQLDLRSRGEPATVAGIDFDAIAQEHRAHHEALRRGPYGQPSDGGDAA